MKFYSPLIEKALKPLTYIAKRSSKLVNADKLMNEYKFKNYIL